MKFRYSCWILIKVEFSEQIFVKYSGIKLHENPSSLKSKCSLRTDGQSEGRTDRLTDKQAERKTEMTKLISVLVAFRNFNERA